MTDIDLPLTAEQAAPLFGVTQRWLADDARKPYPVLPVMKLSPHHRLYHLRTCFAVLAHRAGVPLATIAASFGRQPEQSTPAAAEPPSTAGRRQELSGVSNTVAATSIS